MNDPTWFDPVEYYFASELVVEDSSGEPSEVVNVVGREDAIQQRIASVTA